MESREIKNDSESRFKSRFQRNEELYNEISKNDLEGYDIKSNAEVIGDNNPEIDVEKIKRILDTKYNDVPKRKSLRIEDEEEVKQVIDDTKEYDINVVLERAKNEKDENYEEERLQQVHSTQYDILNNLDVEEVEEEKDEEDNLQTLIDTIAINETNKNDTDASLDILSDLKGNDNTEKLDGLKEEIETSTNEIIDIDDSQDFKITIDDDTKIDLEEEIKIDKKDEKEVSKTEMINSFYTSSNALKRKDFEKDDFADGINEGSSIVVKIIITLIILVFLVGVGILIKTIFF